jgi:hypothetical protein
LQADVGVAHGIELDRPLDLEGSFVSLGADGNERAHAKYGQCGEQIYQTAARGRDLDCSWMKHVIVLGGWVGWDRSSLNPIPAGAKVVTWLKGIFDGPQNERGSHSATGGYNEQFTLCPLHPFAISRGRS